MCLTQFPDSRDDDGENRPRGLTVIRPDASAQDPTWPRESPIAPAPPRPGTSVPAARHLLVPVRAAASGRETIRFFRDPMGARVAIAFTSAARLRTLLGRDQRWSAMAESCLRETIAAVGVGGIVLDPRMTAPPARATGGTESGGAESGFPAAESRR